MSTPTLQRPFVLAIDFDDTIFGGGWPDMSAGKLLPGAKEALTALSQQGNYIIVNTCRSGVAEKEAADFLLANGIPFDALNANAPFIKEFYKGDCRKIWADIYVDDKNLGGLPKDWADIYQLIQLHLDYLRKNIKPL